jgi:hypothetical protein
MLIGSSRASLALLLTLGLGAAASALTVGIAPAEDSSFASGRDGKNSPMSALVSGCMDQLFESGYIVTDAPVSRPSPEEWGPEDYGLAQAKEGLVDCVIAVFVEWENSSYHASSLLPKAVEYRLLRVKDGKLLGEGKMDGPQDTEKSSVDQDSTASKAGKALMSICIGKISSLSKGGEL